ncbi:MAG: hypothetical protein A3D96_04370 [Chlamydiae bacterium RIFCSPHIGHO2_12_FULL_44_59]|nr:MAG: hypothetical protein A2796_04145 [Chlamydiae bacterium RIFCSPHIGHO2_01_FULL_44_39]OGN56465.1 MAG: hypothetical protein A3C42_02210 [Chlamydiae bacterium RIFCSPHIGHO2_02_FULL_45_9]OGN60324.1 MAG: hypothetical protein A3D96_04370 [Chlamydiae bacterium RIFCSPHIGHO2_12_FULL_44_59]OGN66307.1 MAG: hypothetical protein A2978_01815 [Chlamydiae bacterium RIFCSPLOWO2_01_FULL_44_52]OGN69258.1 MAG: hypothetical protein A3I67_00675 [Chlamydiae bacterium RIFCSPLOWO2_02_FULL_45_22]OGN70198.1 MAG: hyp
MTCYTALIYEFISRKWYNVVMKKKWALLFFCVLVISSLSYIWISRTLRSSQSEKIQHVKCKHGPYFFSIFIHQFTAADLPCLSMQMNGHTVSVMLDLGFRGQLSFPPRFLQQVENKKYLRSKKMYGLRGGEYEEKLYEVPTISVGPIVFSHPVIHEHSEEFHRESSLVQKDHKSSPSEQGRIGWELFVNTNLFLDLNNSKVAFCDSISTLQKEGYFFEAFAKTPLFLERGLVEFEVETPEGVLRCMLDTGATWNVLNTDLEEGKSIEQVIWEPDNVLKYSSFKIDKKNFGPVAFHRIPIKIPVHIEAILGMEFFHHHLVFLDFAENVAYFSKNRHQFK